MFDSFLSDLGRRFPLLALIYVDRQFDPRRRLDVDNLFPAEVGVVKMQFPLLADTAASQGWYSY